MFTGGASVISSGIPAWYTTADPAVGDWVEIEGSSPSEIPLEIYANDNNGNWIDPWSGPVCNADGWLIDPAGGGHADCYENKVTGINMMADAPVWEILLDDSDITAIPLQGTAEDSGTPYYTDGRPASAHLYYCPLPIEARHRVIRFGATAVAGSLGKHWPTVDGFDWDTNTWDAEDTFPDINPNPAGGGQTGWCVCKDGDENVYILIGNSSLSKWTQSSNTWSTLTGGPPSVDGFEYASAYDTSRDEILVLKSDSVALYNVVGTPGWSTPVLSGASATGLESLGKGAGMEYNATLDRYLVRGGSEGQTVYVLEKVAADEFEVTTLSTGGGTPPAVDAVGGGSENVYRKFSPAPAVLKGYFYVPKFSENVWFLRTH